MIAQEKLFLFTVMVYAGVSCTAASTMMHVLGSLMHVAGDSLQKDMLMQFPDVKLYVFALPSMLQRCHDMDVAAAYLRPEKSIVR